MFFPLHITMEEGYNTDEMQGWWPRVTSRRYRRILIACLATLGISAALLGAVWAMRWHSKGAMRGDTRVVLTQAAAQLLRTLESRRGTLTLLRDTLGRSPVLSLPQQRALARSAAAHTRHLLGVGIIRTGQPLVWWVDPSATTATQRRNLAQTVAQRTRLRHGWRHPSTFTWWLPSDRPRLVMMEPLRASAGRASAVVGVFDLKPLLADFFELILQQPFPVQLMEGDRLVYQSPNWALPMSDQRPLSIQESVQLDALRWTLSMQPGTTQVARTISWFNSLFLVFSAAMGITGSAIIWLLAMRTRILQAAVSRRTAALRRAAQRLRQLATTDELTGLHNRRFFLERWPLEYARAMRYGRPLCCLLIDVNGFKHVNDTLGHHVGDLVLQQVARELTANLRQSDLLARFGGDEFIIALPETSVEQATLVAEKLRRLRLHGPWEQQPRLGAVRLSVGLGRLEPNRSAEDTIQQADAAMYASRKSESAPHGTTTEGMSDILLVNE